MAEYFFSTSGSEYLETASRRSVRQDAIILDRSVPATSENVFIEAITVATFIPGFIRKPLVVVHRTAQATARVAEQGARPSGYHPGRNAHLQGCP